MKTETKKRIWTEVVNQLNNEVAGGKSFQLKFSQSDYKVGIKIFNGQWWTMPDDIVEQLTGTANAFIEAEREKAKQETARWIEQHRKDREALERRFDEDGFTLIAGEESEIIHQGTLRECKDNIWKVSKCPRDHYSGLGCYIIVKGEEEVMSGTFDRDCSY